MGMRLLGPRLHILLQSWLDRSDTAREKRQAELKTLRSRLTNLDGESAQVIKLVRNGICSPDDPQIATELANIAAQKRAIEADVGLVETQLASGNRAITPETIERFGTLLSSKLCDRDAPLQREYVRLLIDKVEVGNDVIRITGTKDALAVAASSPPGKRSAQSCTEMARPAGLEPATPSLEGSCSIQLNYGRARGSP